MARMVSLKRPKSDAGGNGASQPSEYANPDDDGVSVHLDHHHLMKLKGDDGEPIAGRMKSGHKVSFSGSGVVERSESRSGKDGERHSATIRLHRGGIEHEGGADDERGELRSELMRVHEKSESAAHERAERKSVKP